MNLLPKFKRCPYCNSVNWIKINGLTLENEFESLNSWILKKKFNCKKCKIELGLFINIQNKKEEKLVWIDFLKCKEFYLDKLNKLQKNKIKYKEKNKEKEYEKVVKEIQTIQNQIRLDEIKVKIKAKIENKGMLI